MHLHLVLVGHLRRLVSEPSHLDMKSSQPIFDQPPSRSTGVLLSDDSANAEGSEDIWAEIKVGTGTEVVSATHRMASASSIQRSDFRYVSNPIRHV